MHAHLRIARPTDRLDEVVAFYRDALGFEVVGGFRDHEGFDGVMLGHPGAGYHLEFTRQQGARAAGAPGPEHLLIFYLPDRAGFESAVARIERLGHAAVSSHNPYWDRGGRTYEDPDRYRVVLYLGEWVGHAGQEAHNGGQQARRSGRS